MNAGNRLRALRSELNLNQTEFGEKVDLKQSAIGQMETGVRNITNRTAMLLNKAYGVSQNWLLHGIGEMWDSGKVTALEYLAEEYNLTDLEKKIIGNYLKLTKTERGAIQKYLESLVNDKEKPRRNNKYMIASRNRQRRIRIKNQVLTDEQIDFLKESPEVKSLDDFQKKNKDE